MFLRDDWNLNKKIRYHPKAVNYLTIQTLLIILFLAIAYKWMSIKIIECSTLWMYEAKGMNAQCELNVQVWITWGSDNGSWTSSRRELKTRSYRESHRKKPSKARLAVQESNKTAVKMKAIKQKERGERDVEREKQTIVDNKVESIEKWRESMFYKLHSPR